MKSITKSAGEGTGRLTAVGGLVALVSALLIAVPVPASAEAGTLPQITAAPPSEVTLTVGVPYSFTYSVSGDPVPTVGTSGTSVGLGSCSVGPDGEVCTMRTNELPPGLTLSDGVISGVPTEAGVAGGPSFPDYASVEYRFTALARNGVEDPTFARSEATATTTFTVIAPPVIATESLTPGTVGEAYSAIVTATGIPTPTVSQTGLPTGLEMSSTGQITGTPTQAGTFTVNVTAENRSGSDNRTYTLTIAAPPRPKADLDVTVTGPTGPIARGTRVTYVVSVRNTGPAAATNVSTVVSVNNLTAVSAAGAARQGNILGVSGAVYQAATLAPGATLSYTVDGTASGRPGTIIGATAATTSQTPDPGLLNNISYKSTKIR